MTIPSIATITAPAPVSAATTRGGDAFQAVLTEAISKVEAFQRNAQTGAERFLSGEDEELHHLAIASQQAELSFQLFLQMRNKVVAAYQQVMQMQV